MSSGSDRQEDMEDLGNEALVFAYGHNVNLYRDVFSITDKSSTKEIYLTYMGLLKELEIAQNVFREYHDQDEVKKQYAVRLGMKPSHFAVGMHPRDFLEIKTDAVKRAYDILADKKSRKEYDDCLREYQESFENAQLDSSEVNDVTDVSSDEDEDDCNDGDDSRYEASSIQAQVDSDFPLLASHHHDDDVFDPFNLHDEELSGQSDFTTSFTEKTFESMQDSDIVPVSPDIDIAFSASFTGMHPNGHETSMRICALPSPDSDESSDGSYPELLADSRRKTSLEPEADIHLPSNLSSEEEDELVSFQELSKSMSDMDEKQHAFFQQMDAGLDNVECFSEDDSDIVEQDDVDNMSLASETKDRELITESEGQQVWCLDAFMDEVTGTLDDTAITIEQMCGIAK